MELSGSQLVGLVVTGLVIAFALAFLAFARPRVNAIFRPSLTNVVAAAVLLLILQAGFVLLGNA